MVYTDGIHLIADNLDELHEFAEKIGLKRCWYEGVRKGHPHYDLHGNMKNKAIEAGAQVRTTRELVHIYSNKVYKQTKIDF